MADGEKSRGELEYEAALKKNRPALREKERADAARAANVARLKSLRLEKEAADRAAAEVAAAEKASAKAEAKSKARSQKKASAAKAV